jgi:four helix bundle protein
MIGRNYEDLEIYKKSYALALKIHNMTTKLPKVEFYEEGVQIRRSSKSIAINIAEGFGRRRYKKEFIRFLIFSHASCDETKVHLKFIFDLGYIDKNEFKQYYEDYDDLGLKIYKFLNTVKKEHKT